MIKYGLISETDARCLEKTIDLICDEFDKDGVIFITEIGIYNGDTMKGIKEYMNSKWKRGYYTGIDNEKDKEIICGGYDKQIIGNSSEVYNQLEDESQHMIFFDGDHTKIGVISDFFAYADKVKVGGYIAFHDTGKHIKPFKDFQHGDKGNPDAYIAVRKALENLGLFEPYKGVIKFDWYFNTASVGNWGLVFDEADETNEAGGICVFKKLY